MTNTNQTEVTGRALVDASSILKANTKIVVVSAIVVWCGMSAHWAYKPLVKIQTLSELGVGIALLTSVFLGAVLGYRAQQLDGVRPVGAALGVAWRLGFVWVVLAAITEHAITGTAEITAHQFPKTLLPHMLLIVVMFIAGYVVAMW